MNLVEFLDSRNLLAHACDHLESAHGADFVRKFLSRAANTNVRISNRPTRYLGQVRHQYGKHTGEIFWIEVVFSNSLFILDKSHVEDTILHELAHFVDLLIRGKSNHDRHWQSIARTLGATPTAKASGLPEDYKVHSAKYVWECANRCGFATYLKRKKKFPITRYRCPRCDSKLVDTTEEKKMKVAAKYSS